VFVIKPIGKKKKSIFYYVPTLLPGLIIFLVVVIPTVVGQYFVPPSQLRVMADAPNLPPSTKHILGTQSEGRDVFALLLKGTPGTLSMGVIGGLVGLTIGTCLGLISGYAGGKVDTTIRLLVDVALTIPSLALLIMIAATFRGLSLLMMGVVLALTSWMQSTRVIRSQVLSLRERNFIKMAKLSGMSDLYIVFREILPNLLPFVVAAFVDAVSSAILASIGLEILGLGSQQNQTLGNTIYYAIYYSAMWRGLWWWWLPPVIILVMIFLSLFLLSVSLDQYSNPRLQRAG
jgi:peptide/nickel transport system permease protein